MCVGNNFATVVRNVYLRLIGYKNHKNRLRLARDGVRYTAWPRLIWVTLYNMHYVSGREVVTSQAAAHLICTNARLVVSICVTPAGRGVHHPSAERSAEMSSSVYEMLYRTRAAWHFGPLTARTGRYAGRIDA